MAYSIRDIDEKDLMAVVRRYLRRAGVLLAVADEATPTDEERQKLLREALVFARTATAGLGQLHDHVLGRIAGRHEAELLGDDTLIDELEITPTAPHRF